MSPSYQLLSHFRHCWPNKKPCSQGATTTYLRRSEPRRSRGQDRPDRPTPQQPNLRRARNPGKQVVETASPARSRPREHAAIRESERLQFGPNEFREYVFTVKANQPGLFARCKALPWAKIRATSAVDVGHGRRVRRTIKVAAAPALLDFAGAVQVAQIRRTRTQAGNKSVEVVYVITSLPSTQASPTQIATWVQGHWGIENKLHWVRDVIFDEDRSSIRTGNAPRVMATLRSTAISVLHLTGTGGIARATRHHARDAHRPVQLLLTC